MAEAVKLHVKFAPKTFNIDPYEDHENADNESKILNIENDREKIDSWVSTADDKTAGKEMESAEDVEQKLEEPKERELDLEQLPVVDEDGAALEEQENEKHEDGAVVNFFKKAANKIANVAAGAKDSVSSASAAAASASSTGKEKKDWKPAMDFLKATRYGDSRKVEKLLEKNPELDVNTRDMMGNSPLILAVRNDHPEVVHRLLNRVPYAAMREALLLSISLDHHHISEDIIRHPRYQPTVSDDTAQAAVKVSDISLETASDDTLFAADVTPLVLAAQRNQFEIVKLLLSMGERIREPHDYHCTCSDCRGAESFDELRFAKTRLNLFKGLASEAYVSLSNEDPLLAAFQLGHKLKTNAEVEKHFKTDYRKLCRQLSDYAVKLLDKIRDGEELDILLNEAHGTPFGDLGKMARLKVAIRYQEKLFVTHASCQKKLTHIWYGDRRRLQTFHVLIQAMYLIAFLATYPLLALLFWFYPWGSVGRFLSTPVIKFVADACSRLGFAGLILYYTFTESASQGIRLAEHARMGSLYQTYVNDCVVAGTEPAIGDVYLRSDDVRILTYVVTLFILGYVWQMLKTMALEKLHFFIDNFYNIMDVVMLSLYVTSFTLRYLTVIKVGNAIDHFSSRDSWSRMLLSNDSGEDDHLYWLDADRYTWKEYDTTYLMEASFAIANLMCIIRTSYIMSTSEVVGPLLISLKQMIKNVLVFMVIFLIVIVAFIVAFHSLYWYYNSDVRDEAESSPHEDTNAENYFGRLLLICRTVYFSLFGMMEPDVVELGGGYKELVTATVGYALFGAYNWITVIVLINMLIAMMARSYEFIDAAKDMEWKFDRTKLYLDYIKEGNVLCVPFNLVPTWFGFIECMQDICTCCGFRDPAVIQRRRNERERQKAKMKFVNQSYQVHTDDVTSLDGEATAVQRDTGEDRIRTRPIEDKDSLPASYKRVISKVRQRFIVHNSSKEKEDEKGDMDAAGMYNAMKRELSNFRFEMVKTLRRQEKDRNKMRDELRSVDEKLQTARDEVKEVASTCQALETLLTDEIRQGVCDGNVKLINVDQNVVSVRGDFTSHENSVSQKLHSLESKVLDSITRFDPVMASLSDVQSRLRRLATEREDAGSSRIGYHSLQQAQRTGLPVAQTSSAAKPSPTAAAAQTRSPPTSGPAAESTSRKTPAVASSTKADAETGNSENVEPAFIHGVKLKKVRLLPDN